MLKRFFRTLLANFFLSANKDCWQECNGGLFYVTGINEEGYYEGWRLNWFRDQIYFSEIHPFELGEIVEDSRQIVFNFIEAARRKSFFNNVDFRTVDISFDNSFFYIRDGRRVTMWDTKNGWIPIPNEIEEKKLTFCFEGMPLLCTKEGVFREGEKLSFDDFLTKYPDCQEVIKFRNEL